MNYFDVVVGLCRRKDAMVKYSEIVEALESGDEAVAGTLDGSDDDDHEADVLQSGFGGVGMKGYEETTTDGHEGPSRERRQQPLLDLSHWATMGDVKSVQYVLDQQGPEIIDRKDEMGMTALMRAADRNKVDVIEVLLERGADVDQVDSDGQTALHYATFCGHIEATSALLYGGANMNKKDKEGKTAFETGNSEVRDFLTNNHDRIQKARLDKEKARREKTLRRSHQENDADMEDLVTRSLARLNQTSIFDAALVALFALGIAWICVRYNKTPGSAAL